MTKIYNSSRWTGSGPDISGDLYTSDNMSNDAIEWVHSSGEDDIESFLIKAGRVQGRSAKAELTEIRIKEKHEQDMREKYPALKEAYEQYLTVLELVSNDKSDEE